MMTDKYKTLFVILALTLATFTVFWQVHSFEFTNYDDNSYVSENTHILTGFTPGNIFWAFTSPHYFMWHPITTLTNLLDYQFFGLKPGWHHITNLIFHIANALLLFAVFRKITGRIWPSAFVAAAFALHPLNVESVAWIAERKNVVSAFFWLLTIAAYVRYANHRHIANYLLVVLMFSLALMSKPTTVTLPFVLLLLDYWPLGRIHWTAEGNTKSKSSIWPLITEKIPLFVLSAILCVITVIVQKSGSVLKMNEYFPFSVRLSNALVSYILYIGKMIYPLHLAVFYPHPGYSLPLWEAIVSFLTLVAVSVCVIYLGRYKPYLPVGWFWFLGTLVPVIGLVQAGSQRMADRYTYIPLIGLFIIIAWGANDLLAKWKYRTITLGVSSLMIISAIAVCAWGQTGYWHDSIKLFSHTIQVTHENYAAYTDRGLAYNDKGQYDLALADFDKAIELNPKYADAYNDRGNTYAKGKGQYDLAIFDFSKAIEINPTSAEAYNNRGNAYTQGKGLYTKAIADYDKAIELNPKNIEAYNNRANTYKKLGRFDLAIADYNRAIEIDPYNSDVYGNRGNAYTQGLGRFDLAIVDYNKAIEINPRLVDIYFNKAVACEAAGRKKEAIEAYETFIRLASDRQQANYIEHAKRRLKELEQ